MTDAELVEIGGRKFLVGISADLRRPNDVPGVKTGVAWDKVAMYYAMTPEQFEKMVKAQKVTFRD